MQAEGLVWTQDLNTFAMIQLLWSVLNTHMDWTYSIYKCKTTAVDLNFQQSSSFMKVEALRWRTFKKTRKHWSPRGKSLKSLLEALPIVQKKRPLTLEVPCDGGGGDCTHVQWHWYRVGKWPLCILRCVLTALSLPLPFQVNAPSTVTNVELLLPRRGTCWGTSSCTLGRNRSNVPSVATPAGGGTPSQDTSGHTLVSPPRLLLTPLPSFITTVPVQQVVKTKRSSGSVPSSSESAARSFGKALMWIRKVVVQPHLSFCVTELLCWCYRISLSVSPWVYPGFAGRLFWHSGAQSGCEIPEITKNNCGLLEAGFAVHTHFFI